MQKKFLALAIILFAQQVLAQIHFMAQESAGQVVIPGYTPPAESIPPPSAPTSENQPPPNLPAVLLPGGTSSTAITPIPSSTDTKEIVVTPTPQQVKAATSTQPLPASTEIRDQWTKFIPKLRDCTPGIYNLPNIEDPKKSMPFKITGWDSDNTDTQECNLKMQGLECKLTQEAIKLLIEVNSAMMEGREPAKTTNDRYNELTGQQCIPADIAK